jgi:hypothetical protein
MEIKDYIARIREIGRKRDELLSEERVLAKAELTDFSRFGEVCGYCREAYAELHPHKTRRRDVCRQIVFVVVYLYSPASLSGKKMIRGLRDLLAKEFNSTPANISYYVRDIMFFYNHYANFRGDIDYIFARVMQRLKENQ